MNKQRLARKIWESVNKLRSKIEANEYKDYILGVIFYKYLSDKELRFLLSQGWSSSAIKEKLSENNADVRQYVQKRLGYFIAYEHLF